MSSALAVHMGDAFARPPSDRAQAPQEAGRGGGLCRAALAQVRRVDASVRERVSPSAALMHAQPPTRAHLRMHAGNTDAAGRKAYCTPRSKAMVRAAAKWFDDVLRPP